MLAPALVVLQVSAQGALIYDNGPFNIGSLSNSLSISGGRSADDFVLTAPATISGIRFWLNAWSQDNFGGVASYAIYEDSAGGLGSLIASGYGNPAVAIVTVPFNFSGVPRLDLALASPVTLLAGTYWLEMHEGPTLTSNDGSPVYWLARAGVAGNAKRDGALALPTTNTGLALGFQLSGSSAAVPEPGGVLLVFSGLGVLAVWRKRWQCG